MPVSAMEAYLARLETRKAEVKILLADVVSLPHMTKKKREATLKGWMKYLNFEDAKPKPASPARLRMMGIGVKHVGK